MKSLSLSPHTLSSLPTDSSHTDSTRKLLQLVRLTIHQLQLGCPFSSSLRLSLSFVYGDGALSLTEKEREKTLSALPRNDLSLSPKWNDFTLSLHHSFPSPFLSLLHSSFSLLFDVSLFLSGQFFSFLFWREKERSVTTKMAANSLAAAAGEGGDDDENDFVTCFLRSGPLCLLSVDPSLLSLISCPTPFPFREKKGPKNPISPFQGVSLRHLGTMLVTLIAEMIPFPSLPHCSSSPLFEDVKNHLTQTIKLSLFPIQSILKVAKEIGAGAEEWEGALSLFLHQVEWGVSAIESVYQNRSLLSLFRVAEDTLKMISPLSPFPFLSHQPIDWFQNELLPFPHGI